MKRLENITGVIVPIIYHYLISIIISGTLSIYIGYRENVDGIEAISDYYVSQGFGILTVGLTSLLSIPLFLWLMYFDEKHGWIQKWKKLSCRPSYIHWILLVPFSIFSALGLNQFLNVTRLTEVINGYHTTKQVLFSGSFFQSVIVLGIGVPIAEEFMFRGLVFRRLKNIVPVRVAVVISALLFGIYHMNLIQFLYASVFGILLAFIYEKFQNIAAPIIFHSTANLFIYFAGNIKILGQKPYMAYSCIIGICGMLLFELYYSKVQFDKKQIQYNKNIKNNK
ncbi:MAG: type II CAAX endopeptidase family protein [Lachnospiraceae bacterium]|nr:type II CAAX endopeptidase family protein [Lachnospiraceae bacterium]